jgi:endo-1,4-beta-xylanase
LLRKDSWPIAGQHRARCLPGRTTRHYQHVKIHALTAARMFALVLGCGALACAASGDLPDDGGSSGAGGSSGGGGKATGGAGSGGSTVAGSSGFTSGGSNTGGAGKGGSTTGSGGTSGSNTGGSGGAGGSAAGAGNMGGSFGGTGVGGSGAGGSGTGGSAAGAGNTGGNAGGGSGGESAGTGGSSGGAGGAGGGVSGSSGGGAGGSTGGTGGSIGEPDCNAQMPGGGQLHSGNGTGGQGNLAWEIWSNTGEGELTTFSTPAFIATWNNSGGYLGRLGFEWGGFQGNPVPHTERGEIKAQFVSRKTGTAGGYSYIGMYGWTTNPCVEWYVVDDSYNNMPINPGNTTNEGDVNIDGGTYVVYTRPTTGSGGTRCSGATDWIQYYSVRRTARACGVISLSEHFRKWEELGMDMGGELLEAKILVEVGGGVGNVELPIANVNVQ